MDRETGRSRGFGFVEMESDKALRPPCRRSREARRRTQRRSTEARGAHRARPGERVARAPPATGRRSEAAHRVLHRRPPRRASTIDLVVAASAPTERLRIFDRPPDRTDRLRSRRSAVVDGATNAAAARTVSVARGWSHPQCLQAEHRNWRGAHPRSVMSMSADAAEHRPGRARVWPLCVIGGGRTDCSPAFAARGARARWCSNPSSSRAPRSALAAANAATSCRRPSKLDDFHIAARATRCATCCSWARQSARVLARLRRRAKIESTGKVFPPAARTRSMHGLLSACERAGARCSPARGCASCDAASRRRSALRVALASDELIRCARRPVHRRVVAAQDRQRRLGLPARSDHRADFRRSCRCSLSRVGELAGVSLRVHQRATRRRNAPTAQATCCSRTRASTVPWRSTSLWVTAAHVRNWCWLGDLERGTRGCKRRSARRHRCAVASAAPGRRAARSRSRRNASCRTTPRRQRRLAQTLATAARRHRQRGLSHSRGLSGSVPLEEVSTRTLECARCPANTSPARSRRHRRIGGFNSLWAWVAAAKVGLAVAEDTKQRGRFGRPRVGWAICVGSTAVGHHAVGQVRGLGRRRVAEPPAPARSCRPSRGCRSKSGG